MLSSRNWKWFDWLLILALFLIILFVVAGNSGLATFVRGALHLLAGALLWAGNALNAIGR